MKTPTNTQLREAVARIEGWKDFDIEDGALMGHIMKTDGWLRYDMVPEYDTDRDETIRVILAQPDDVQREIAREVCRAIPINGMICDAGVGTLTLSEIASILTAPANVLCTAVCRVLAPEVFEGKE